MEALNLEDSPGQQHQQPLGSGQLPPQQQLPPQMFTTAAQLLDMTDSKDPFYSGEGGGEHWMCGSTKSGRAWMMVFES